MDAGYPASLPKRILASQSDSYNHPNGAIEPRIPAHLRLLHRGRRGVALAVAGEKSVQEALDAAAAKWDEITDRNGRESQIALTKRHLAY